MAAVSNELIEQLINGVKLNRHLYDANDKDYKDQKKKEETWDDFSICFDQPSSVLKTKWKNLRDSYVKYQKCQKGETGSIRRYQNWPWASHLEFLNESVHRTSQSFDDESTVDLIHASQDPLLTFKDRRKRKIDDSLLNTEFSVHTECETKLDRTDYLFLNYSETFKKFSPKMQVELKLKLSKVFADAELRHINSEQ